MRDYSMARGTFWQGYPYYYSVIGKALPAPALSNLVKRNV